MKAERSGGGERDRKSVEERKSKWYSERRVKEQEGNGKVWVGKEREREREVGQKESWRREGGILSWCTVTYSCYCTQGVRFPPPSQSRRTERRQRGNEICCFISPNFSCWYFSLPWKSILSNRFLFDLVSIGTEIQYLSLCVLFFYSDFWFYHAGVIIGQPS